ncbi:MAG: helix-turn-helix domain-containing protein [Bellilinea sp.]
MSTYQQTIRVRGRKLGILIYDARISRAHTPEKCAKAMNIPVEDYLKIEAGELAPTLPQLELLAFHLDIPIEHFWGNQTMASLAGPEPVFQVKQLVELRQRIIGTRLRMARTALNLSVTELANKTFIPGEKIQQYELGQTAIPLPELEILAAELEIRTEDLLDKRGPIGKWRNDKAAVQQFLELPPEIRDFIGRPINQPFLELAMRLSNLSVEKLRGVAEGLLEITF